MPSVNLWTSNWRWTGSNVQTPQAKVDLEFQWTDDTGMEHSWQGEATFPNDLRLVPVAWVREVMEELMIRAARHVAGVDA